MISLSNIARAFVGLGVIACTACVALAPRSDASEASQAFYTVTGEIALSRHEPRVAALEYAAAAENDRDVGLLQRATEVTVECLQPSLTVAVASRWIEVDPGSVDAHRAVGRAALDLHRIEQSAAHYRAVLRTSPRGTEAEFAALETELAAADNVYGVRQLADRLAVYFPASAAALRMQAYAALRADDPAAAVHSFNAALARSAGPPAGAAGVADKTGGAREAGAADEAGDVGHGGGTSETSEASGASGGTPRAADDVSEVVLAGAQEATRRELTQGLLRARILSGDVDGPLAQAKAAADQGDAESRLDYALLLLAAQQSSGARAQLVALTKDREAAPAALRLLGLIEFQEGRIDEAAAHFAQLGTTGKFLDDALYYLGLIAERHEDLERALRFYAQVQNGENAVPALLRAASILRAHGAAPEAEELLDRLVEEEPQRAPEILASRARIYSEAGDEPQAAALLEVATLQYPDSVELRYATASLAEEQGKVSDALRELKAVAKERPSDPAALNAYGYTLADHKRRLGSARRLIEQAYASAPKNAAILDSFGWVLYRQGHDEQALAYLNAAYADDRGGDIAAHLGEVLWQLGRQAEAERIWSEANRADAGNALLKATRLRLHASN